MMTLEPRTDINVMSNLMNISWNINDLKELFTLSNQLGDNWEKISFSLRKSPDECMEIYNLMLSFAMALYEEEEAPLKKTKAKKKLIKQNKPISDSKKKRQRRKASQIERLYKCREKHCNRSYGTEGALKMHLKLKHPTVKYDSRYYFQARQAANSMNLSVNEDEEEINETSLILSTGFSTPNNNANPNLPEPTLIMAPSPVNYYPTNQNELLYRNLWEKNNDKVYITTPIPNNDPYTKKMSVNSLID